MRLRRPTAVLFGATALLAATSSLLAANDPDARFRGTPPGNLAATNVRWEAATKEYSHVTFDLSWSGSWRAAWVEPADSSVTGRDLRIESWDAAWVFVKFLAEKDSKASIERNHWQHATLAADAAHHVIPAGATNAVGLTDDPSTGLGARGRRGIGVFIYRDAIGCGANDFKGVKLRWLHGADKVDPARAAVRVRALAMVYVPEGPFKAGSGIRVPIERFPDGPKRPVVGGPLPGKTPEWPRGCFGEFTDGAWRGGEPTIPFLVDAEWNGPVAVGSRARRIGPRPGLLWGNLVYDFHNRGLSAGFGSMAPVGDGYPPATVHNDYPTGYDAFYCMKYPLTQGQYATFLNSLPPDAAAERGFVSGDGKMPNSGVTTAFIIVDKRKVSPGPGYRPHTIEEWDGHTITCSTDRVPRIPTSVDAGGGVRLGTDAGQDVDVVGSLIRDAMAEEKNKDKPKRPPVFTARLPDRPCGWIGWVDGFAYAVWAGLRPMTELEFEKARRGPLDPMRTEPASRRADPSTAIRGAWEDLTATYWGSWGLGGTPITIGSSAGRAFRGTHGDGRTPAGTPGAPLRRTGFRYDPDSGFDTAPADWPRGVEGGKEGVGGRAYIGRRPYRLPRTRFGCGRTAPAAHKPMSTRTRPSPQAAAKTHLPGDLPLKAPPADAIKITNVKWEAGTRDYSFVTFDLAWKGSWRAAWTEPADKNVTGKPMKIENWDAAWVFVKFRRPGAAGTSHATLSSDRDDHQAPVGAALGVGLDSDGDKGLGVFIYRDAVGQGDNDFKGIKLRWLHGADGADPGKARPAAHAIGMVYVDEGPFKSKSPLRRPVLAKKKERPYSRRLPLTLISTVDATKPGGYYADAGERVPEHHEWANGYRAFYCMKRSISQGQYAAFLNSVPADLNAPNNNAERYLIGALASETPRRYNARLYRLCGYTITTDAAGAYQADAPNRPCNFLSWPDIQSYSAWAALRPPTALEYEKACRGPRDFARDADAWSEGVCAPAAGVPAQAASGASYWGIRQLSLNGCVHEWPGTVGNGLNREGLQFKATHGSGTPKSPADWPKTTAFGDWFYMSWEAGGSTLGFCSIGIWVLPSQMGRVRENWLIMDADRTGRYGARAVRTAPLSAD